jgi:hypothetical protein
MDWREKELSLSFKTSKPDCAFRVWPAPPLSRAALQTGYPEFSFVEVNDENSQLDV